MTDLSRRGLLAGLGAGLIAAPAIVRAASLMPVRALKIVPPLYSVILDAQGNIAAIEILHAGSGYTSPVITILDRCTVQFSEGSQEHTSLARQLISKLEGGEYE